MGRWEHSTDGCGESVDGAERGIGQSHATEEAGQRHIGSGVKVIWRGADAAQRPGRALYSVKAEGVSDWSGANGDVWLNQLRQSIHAGAGAEGRRQIFGQLWIDDGQAWKHERAAQADFDAMFRRGEDCIARNFGARSGGGRNGNAR